MLIELLRKETQKALQKSFFDLYRALILPISFLEDKKIIRTSS